MRIPWRAAALTVVFMSLAAAAFAIEARSGDHVAVEGETRDVLFAAGEEVDITVTALDDVFAAGGNVSVTQTTAPHLFLAGGNVSVVNTNATDIIAAGGEIGIIGGQISDDVIAAGRRIRLGAQARIDGSVVLAGEMLRIDAPIGESLRAVGRSIHLNGSVGGDVYLDGENIVIGPHARIAGNLRHRGRVEIAPDAVIVGEVTALQPRPRADMRPLAAFAGVVFLALLLGLVVMAAVTALALPALMNDAAQTARAKPLHMLGLGLLVAVLAPIMIVVLALTLIGAPLAFLVGALMVALWPLAVVAAAYALGAAARQRMRKAEEPPRAAARALWTGAAMIVLCVVGLIPFVGALIWMVTYWIGLGASLLALRRSLSLRQA